MNFKTSGKLKAVTFSYDDGCLQDIRLTELFNKYGLKSTFNLNSALLGKKGFQDREGKRISLDKVSKEDVRKVYAGHEVGSHTLTHPLLTELKDEEIFYQVEQDRLRLSELAGYEVEGFAYPCGGNNTDGRVERIIREQTGIRYARSGPSTFSFDLGETLFHIRPTSPQNRFARLMEMGREFAEMKPDTPQIFFVWGHSYELDYEADYWQKLEDFFKLISGHDDIFYGTNKEVFL